MITKLKLINMEYKIIETHTFDNLDTTVHISYYVPKKDRFYIQIFELDSIQHEIISKSNSQRDILHNFIIRKHDRASEYTYEQIKQFIDSKVLTQFIREQKLDELLK